MYGLFYASYRRGLTVESSRGLGVGRNYGGTTDGRTDMDHNGDDVQSAAERTGVDGIHYRAETGIRRFFCQQSRQSTRSQAGNKKWVNKPLEQYVLDEIIRSLENSHLVIHDLQT